MPGAQSAAKMLLCVLVKIMPLFSLISNYLYPSSFQIPQCYPDHVPTHLALPNHSGHYKQGCPQASAGSEGFGEGHTAGTILLIFNPFCLQSAHSYQVIAYGPYFWSMSNWLCNPIVSLISFLAQGSVYGFNSTLEKSLEPSTSDK